MDVLVIGSGVAGLTYALKVADRFRVALVTKKEHTESNTNYAQGGIAAVMTPEDSVALHVEDTLVAGAGLCHREAVEQMVREGPQRVRELIEWGAQFSQQAANGGEPRLALGQEGGHSRRRIVHARDLTGREVERTLVTAVQRHPNISVFEHHAAVDLLIAREGTADGGRWTTDDGRRTMDDGRWTEGAHGVGPGRRQTDESRPPSIVHRPSSIVRGAAVLDTRTGAVKRFTARVTVLATGGCGQVYLHTTNPEIATGDGVGMAYRAGAAVANMEFIQFHPTTLYHPQARSFLISEAVRGEGGILKLADGTPFMEKYHPLASLAPRDVVARAIDAEMKASGEDSVCLDLTHLDPNEVRVRFPHIYERCRSFGIDITRTPIPIVPAAHYSCGGVSTDLIARTTLDRLFAIGEVACTGVHGANRLASNSLLEALVFAHHAAEATRHLLAGAADGEASAEEPALPENDPQRAAREVSPEFVAQLRVLVQTLMWSHVGIVRSDRRLAQALREVSLLRGAIETLYGTSRVTEGLLELRNIAQVAQLIIECALLRKESRGLHYNVDHPERNDAEWARDTVLS
jgi:L-aspartate oxidase